MINYNGTLFADNESVITHNNRAFKLGDAVFETIKVVGNTIFFMEDHYFRLMAAMRIMRMDIPMEFTMPYLEKEILNTVKASGLENARIRLNVYRDAEGAFMPSSQKVGFLIEAQALENTEYTINTGEYEIDIYKDFKKNKGLLMNYKYHHFQEHILASIYAKEYGYDNCLMINYDNKIVEAINGNLFVVKDGKIFTPKLTDGCIDGVLRKNLIELIKKDENLSIEEKEIFPFEIQKAEEIFITNVISGITSITKYRKATYKKEVAKLLVEKLNEIKHVEEEQV